MILGENLTYSYSTQKTLAFPSFSVEANNSLLILGNSGVGKTTLLHILGLLLQPKNGLLKINNTVINTLSGSQLSQFRANHIGLIFQKPHFVTSLTTADNLILSNYLADRKTDKTQLEYLANELNINDLLAKKTWQLSLGEQQRVGIARALMNKPSVILADEPTSSLDDENCQKVIELLQNQAKQIGACLIIVTHDQRLKSVFSNQILLK